MRICMVLSVLFLLAALPGCATTDDVAVDAGSPFPSWCADMVRRHDEMPSPRSGSKPGLRLPPECTEATGAPLFPIGVPDPTPPE